MPGVSPASLHKVRPPQAGTAAAKGRHRAASRASATRTAGQASSGSGLRLPPGYGYPPVPPFRVPSTAPVAQTHLRHRGTEPHTAIPTGRRAILQQAPAPLSLRLLQRLPGPSVLSLPTANAHKATIHGHRHTAFFRRQNHRLWRCSMNKKNGKKAPSPHGFTCPPRPPPRLTCLQRRPWRCLRRGQPPSPHGKDTQGSPARPSLPSFSAVRGPQPRKGLEPFLG